MVGVVALATAGASAYFIFQFEQQITEKRAGSHLFETRAREAVDALGDVRVAQAGYVAAGQGADFWAAKVKASLNRASESIAALRSAAVGSTSQSALDDAAASLVEFARIDTRAREYVSSSQPLMAGDVIFMEGEETAAEAARNVYAARQAEQQRFDTDEWLIRKQQAAAAAGASVLMAVVILTLVPAPQRVRPEAVPGPTTVMPARSPLAEARAIDERRTVAAPPAPRNAMLSTAAALCTELGAASDVDEIRRLLARISDALDASGLIVWMNGSGAGVLEPVLSHGYTAQAVARMGSIPRNAGNAAAAAVRSGRLQIVLARPGVSGGAIVAPLLSPQGCIGALSAEIRGGAESSDAVQAIAAIVAAQLAGILQAAPAAAEPESRRSAVNG